MTHAFGPLSTNKHEFAFVTFYLTTHITSGQKMRTSEQKHWFYCSELVTGSKRFHLLPGTSNVDIPSSS